VNKSRVWVGLWLFSAMVAGAAAPVSAQTMRTPTVDASIGYQVLHLPDETFPVGWNVDVSRAMTDVWRLVGEFGMSHDDQTDGGVSGNLNYYHFGAGPRMTGHAGRVQPFVQVLGGAVHTRADLVLANSGAFSDNDWAFMLQPGAGISIPVGNVVSVIGQADYRRVFFEEEGDNEFRVSFGVRFAFR
jgi:hypothetical protein